MLNTATTTYKCTSNAFTTLDYSSGNPIVSSNSHGASLAQWGNKLYIATGTSGNGGYVWSTTDTYATALTASGTNPHDWQTDWHLERQKPAAGHRRLQRRGLRSAGAHEHFLQPTRQRPARDAADPFCGA